MPISGVVLDHVAVAVEAWRDAWPCYVGRLGGSWHSGGWNVGFAPHQLGFANGARLEILEPWQPEANPFLRRFLDASGPGPHHLTFKVPDLAAALRTAGEAGYQPVSVDLSDPDWKEAFLHPRQATGVVVQLAQASGSWTSPEPEGFPQPGSAPAALTHVTHAVAWLDAGLALFQDLLGGTVARRDEAADGAWEAVTLAWDAPLAVRLVAPGADAPVGGELERWLAGRPGRVHHLAFECPEPPAEDAAAVDVPGVAGDERPVGIVEPRENLGTRLVLRGR